MKTYELKFTDHPDTQKMQIEAKCDGFTSFELLGLLETKKQDILAQIRGEIRPDFVREYVEPTKEE